MKYHIVNLVLNNFKNDSRVLKISRSLQSSGHRVQVVALYDESLPISDLVEGFAVHRVKLTSQNWPRQKLVQLIKYLEFTLRVLLRYRNHDAYYCNDLHTLPLGVLLKWCSRGKKRIIYDAHEYESEASGLGRFERVFRRWLEGLLIRFVERTVTVSDSIAEEYVRLYGIEKPAVIFNVPPLSNVAKQDLFRARLGIEADKTIYLYQGGLSPGRGIEVLLEVFGRQDNGARVIVFMGYGPLESRIRSRADQAANIYFHPAVGANELPYYTSSADVGISTIENTCLSYYYCLPNKLFEYLMAEIPVIVSNLHEMKKLVEAYELGVVTMENSVAGLDRALVEMDRFERERFAANVKRFKSVFNWEAQEARLAGLFGPA